MQSYKDNITIHFKEHRNVDMSLFIPSNMEDSSSVELLLAQSVSPNYNAISSPRS
jgi:hypothetical protein